MPLPTNKKVIQYFFSNNFIRRFIPNFVEIVKPISVMLKKDLNVKWNAESKEAISCASMLVSPIYSKNLQIFSFATEDTVAAVLLQKNSQNLEQSIAFISKTTRESELGYSILEKQAYASV